MEGSSATRPARIRHCVEPTGLLRPLPRRLFDIEAARFGRTIDIGLLDDLGNRRVGSSQVDADHPQRSA